MMEKDHQVGSDVSLEKSLTKKREEKELKTEDATPFYSQLNFHFMQTTPNNQAEVKLLDNCLAKIICLLRERNKRKEGFCNFIRGKCVAAEKKLFI